MLWDRCLSDCPVCNVDVLWPNGWMDQDEICMEVGLGPGHIVLDGDPAPHPQRGGTAAPPLYGPCLLWPNGWIVTWM